jgi:uncharacterized protein
MKEHICDLLRQIEIEKDLKVIFAVDGGSRAVGLESEVSDYDVRFIYVKPVEWYLSLDKHKDYFEYHENKLECVGWDLRKALQLLKRSNPTIIEWFHSPIVYDDPYHFLKNFQSLANAYFSEKAMLYHYFSMAKTNNRLYLQSPEISVKKLFYIVRPLLACHFLIHKKCIPPIDMDTLLKKLDISLELRDEIERLMSNKKSMVIQVERTKLPQVFNFIDDQFDVVETYLTHLSEYKIEIDLLNPFFIQLLKHVWCNLPDINFL